MLEALYHDEIIRLSQKCKSRKRLENPDSTYRADNPICGDKVIIDLKLNKHEILKIGLEVRGCALCEASSEIIAREASGLMPAELLAIENNALRFLTGLDTSLEWDLLSVFRPVKLAKSRHECVLLPFKAINGAIKLDLER